MRLFLMRHAKTEKSGKDSDFERLLTNDGIKQAEKAALFLEDYQIDKLLVSYAKRTMQTANIISKKIEVSNTEIVTELYKANESDVIDLLSKQEDKDKHILVIGHNPTIYNTIMNFVETDLNHYQNLVDTLMPPARIVVIDINIDDWQDINNKRGEIVEIFTP